MGRCAVCLFIVQGATRAFGPGHPDLPEVFREVGKPVLIGGSTPYVISLCTPITDTCISLQAV